MTWVDGSHWDRVRGTELVGLLVRAYTFDYQMLALVTELGMSPVVLTIDRGGEIVTLPAAQQAELEKRLKPIGAEVTKDDPSLKAFYDKVEAIAAKYP